MTAHSMVSSKKLRNAWIWPRRSMIGAAVVIAIGAAGIIGFELGRQPNPMKLLIKASQATDRSTPARLSGFPWAPFHRYRGLRQDATKLDLAEAAGEVFKQAGKQSALEPRHAAAVARLLLNQSTLAADQLGAMTAADGRDAKLFNDLAAARYAAAADHNDPSQLALALSAARNAIRLDPHMAEAKFNGALILEQMHLLSEAREAWAAYLQEDGSTPWAAEARDHLAELGTALADSFDGKGAALEDLAAAGNQAQIEVLVRRFPREARAQFETEVLGEWGETMESNPALAARKLNAARAVGKALVQYRGESLLSDAVAAIDATAANPRRLRALAEAHAGYRAGRKGGSGARDQLSATAKAFRELGSPMAGVASYYEANVVFAQNRIDEARRMLETLKASIDPARYKALEAQVLSQLGLLYGYDGRWNDAVTTLTTAAARFRSIGEAGYAGATESKIAETFDLIAQPVDGWAHRIVAFDLLSRHPFGNKLLVTLAGTTVAELRNGRAESALAMLEIERREAARLHDDAFVADAFRREGLVELRLHDRPSAVEALRSARRSAQKVAAKEVRERIDAEVRMVEGMAIRNTEGQRAIELLSSSIGFFQASDQRFHLPDAYLERGRAFLDAGAPDRAAADFRSGIEELETQRAQLDNDSRAPFFDGSTALFEEAIALLAARGDDKGAFDFAERSRARALLDVFPEPKGHSIPEIQRALVPGTALVEFAIAGDDTLAIFVITGNDFRLIRRPMPRARLREQIDSLIDLLSEPANALPAIRRQSSALHDSLLANVLPGGIQSVIFVPDRELQRVPWAALVNPVTSRYFVEDFTIFMAPSAAVWLQASPNAARPRSETVLAVGSPGGNDSGTDTLVSIDRELAEIAAQFRETSLLTGEKATRSAFLKGCARASLIHFAGHGRPSKGRGRDAALLFTPMGDDRGELTEREIGRMSLPETQLVVLAACDTIHGESGGLDGMPSLARAFLRAGAPVVVGALWPIEDQSSAYLFIEFYRSLHSTHQAARALRLAQVAMIRSPDSRLRNPAAWCAVQAIGRKTDGM